MRDEHVPLLQAVVQPFIEKAVQSPPGLEIMKAATEQARNPESVVSVGTLDRHITGQNFGDTRIMVNPDFKIGFKVRLKTVVYLLRCRHS
jgi:hypothetical protein